MKTWQIVVLVALVLLALAVLAVLVARRAARRAELRRRFGDEYDRTAEQAGGRRQAEAELLEREKRHRQLDIRELSPERQRWYTEAWERTQAGFVENPHLAVAGADALVTDLMSERGYPTKGFEQQAADLSVEHADVISSYREAHVLAQLGNQATTEELRRAMVHYRTLFAELLTAGPDVRAIDVQEETPNHARGETTA